MIFLQLNLVAKKVVFKEGGHVILKMVTKLDDSRFFGQKIMAMDFSGQKLTFTRFSGQKIGICRIFLVKI
jgi:hypothetical protein